MNDIPLGEVINVERVSKLRKIRESNTVQTDKRFYSVVYYLRGFTIRIFSVLNQMKKLQDNNAFRFIWGASTFS